MLKDTIACLEKEVTFLSEEMAIHMRKCKNDKDLKQQVYDKYATDFSIQKKVIFTGDKMLEYILFSAYLNEHGIEYGFESICDGENVTIVIAGT